MIRFDETLLGIWYALVDARTDWMMGATRCADGSVELHYRVRHYSEHSQDPFDDQDAKSWYVAKGQHQGKWMDKVRQVVRHIGSFSSEAPVEILRGERSFADFMGEIARQPWCHIKVDIPNGNNDGFLRL